jgi:hypothetical protein
LQELTKIVSSGAENDNELAAPSGESGLNAGRSCLLEIDVRVAKAESTLKRNLLLLGLISALCERLEHQCLKNTSHIIKFVQVTSLANDVIYNDDVCVVRARLTLLFNICQIGHPSSQVTDLVKRLHTL